MSLVAIVYATTEGHTAKIAHYIADRIRSRGHETVVHHVDALDETFDPRRYAAVVIGGSIHEGRYQRALERWLEQQRQALSASSTWLFTVCLAIASQHEEERQEAMRFPGRLTERTRFTPTHSAIFAGALKYTQYSWLKRTLMKHIAKTEGASTDTSSDHDYTVWSEVDELADGVVAEIERATAAATPRA
jgi:menaquinone-dependent protoporphyrinogen oxidase